LANKLNAKDVRENAAHVDVEASIVALVQSLKDEK
jgi:hypothetical protein